MLSDMAIHAWPVSIRPTHPLMTPLVIHNYSKVQPLLTLLNQRVEGLCNLTPAPLQIFIKVIKVVCC